MAKTTSDSILGVIRKESWILDHFEIFVNIALYNINFKWHIKIYAHGAVVLN